MSVAEEEELAEVSARIKTWSATSRIALAKQILESLDHASGVWKPAWRTPLSQFIGMLKTDGPPPTDEECRQIVEEERMRRYG